MKKSKLVIYKTEVYIWCSDRSDQTGEGRLCLKYLSKIKKNYQPIFIKNLLKNKNNLTHKYIEPFYGVAQLWIKFLLGKKTCYINYLPFWNFLIFLLLPPKTLIGPITGGANNLSSSKIESGFRNLLFPIFYIFTNIIILFRYKKILFATDLLKNKIFKYNQKKSTFNFVYLFFKKNTPYPKKNYFVIYYKKKLNKNYDDIKCILNNKYLINKNYKFFVVGDYYTSSKIINKGYLNNNKLNLLLAKSKFAFGSKENYFSLFALEAINNNVKLVLNEFEYKNIKIFKNMFVKLKLIDKKNFNHKFSDFNKINKKKLILENYFDKV